jgi:hypothetical protein
LNVKVAVCALGGRRGFLELPESLANEEREFIGGGEKSLYELATALAALGVDVELRGHLNSRILATITDAAGATPTVGLEPRRPEPGEVVVLPEGLPDPDLFLTAHLSGARTVVLLLGPPGLCGWSFQAGWSPPDLTVVDVATVGTPATYRAMANLGFSLWSPAWGIAEAGRRAGVRVSRIGTGTPVPFPDPPAKTADIAVIEANRWFPVAEGLAQQLPGATVLRVSSQSVYSLSTALGPAKILPWPSRVEGMSRIAREARAVGTVPVALSSNPFASPRDFGQGAVLAPDVHGVLRETRRLLGAPDELAQRAKLAARSAREQVDWKRYLGRVAAALRQLPASPTADARAEFGDEVVEEHRRLFDALRQEGLEHRGTLDALQKQELEHRGTLDALQKQELEHHRTLDLLQKEELEHRLTGDTLQEAAAENRALAAELAAARSGLDSYRSRRIIRLLDQSRAGAVIRASLRTGRRPISRG